MKSSEKATAAKKNGTELFLVNPNSNTRGDKGNWYGNRKCRQDSIAPGA
jgi:hypothetical protein